MPQLVAVLERHDELLFIFNYECAVLADVVKCYVIVYNEVSDPGNVVKLLGTVSLLDLVMSVPLNPVLLLR